MRKSVFAASRASRKGATRIFEQIDNDREIWKPDLILLANSSESHIAASFFYVSAIPYGLFEGSVLFARRKDGVTLVTNPLEEEIARSNDKRMEIISEPKREDWGKR